MSSSKRWQLLRLFIRYLTISKHARHVILNAARKLSRVDLAEHIAIPPYTHLKLAII